MYKKLIAFIVLFSFCILQTTGFAVQDTSDVVPEGTTICLLGEVVYSQDFEDLSNVETEYFKSDKFSVIQLDDGGRVLQVNGSSVADITTGEIGPEMSGDFAVTADLKQLWCTAANSAYFALGVANTIDESGNHNGYRFAYSDTIRFISDMPYKIGTGEGTERYRDVLSISRAYNTNTMNSLYYGAYEQSAGMLDESKRAFDNFYQMRASVVDNVLTNAVYDNSGNVVKKVVASSEQVNRSITDGNSVDAPSGGKLIINSHSTNMLVDNIKIRKIVTATDVSACLNKQTALLGEQIALSAYATVDGIQQALDLDTISYIYDDQKLCVDVKNGLVKPIAFGNHELVVKFDDVSGTGSITRTLWINCNKGYDVSVVNPSLNVGDSTVYRVYEITSAGATEIKSGYSVECSDGISVDAVSQKIMALSEGLHHMYITVDGVGFEYPVSVCDKSIYVCTDRGESSTYDFDDTVSPLEFSFSNSAVIKNVTDDEQNVVGIPGSNAHGTSALFGNSYTQYRVCTDFKYLSSSTPVDASFGIGVRAGSSGHYQVSYSPACKINTSTGMIDSSSAGTSMKDRLIISYTASNSGQTGNMLRKHTLLAYSQSATGALGTDGTFDKYYRLEVKVTATDISAQLINISDGKVMTSISAQFGSDMIAGGGQTLLNVANTNVYVDRLEISPFVNVNKLKLTVEKNEAELFEKVNVVSVLEGIENIDTALDKLELIYEPDEVDVSGNSIAAKWQGSKYLTAVYRGTDGVEKYATVRLSQPHKIATAFQCTDIHYYDEFDKEIEYMPYAGNVTAEITAKNQLSADSDIVFIAVVYNSDHSMVGLSYTEAFAKAGETVTKNVTVPVNEVNDAAYAEVFAVDNFKNLVPMFHKKTLEHMRTRVGWR